MNKRLAKFSITAALLVGFAVCATQNIYAQRARTVTNTSEATAANTVNIPPAPPTINAKYEGGLIGYSKKLSGTLTFDDINQRFVFRDKDERDIMAMPYQAILAAYADTQSRRPMAATVAGSLPVPYGLNLPALFIRKKYRFLTIQFRDPDTQAAGVVSFEVEDKNILASELATLANKAGLMQRGEAFVRKLPVAATTPTTPVPTATP